MKAVIEEINFLKLLKDREIRRLRGSSDPYKSERLEETSKNFDRVAALVYKAGETLEENSELKKVREMWKKLELDWGDVGVWDAHRVGKSYRVLSNVMRDVEKEVMNPCKKVIHVEVVGKTDGQVDMAIADIVNYGFMNCTEIKRNVNIKVIKNK